MDTETICSACSWSPTRQSHCRYHSHVKLFYSAGNRGAWSLGSKFILKERDNNPPNNETSNIRFLTERTSIPIPQVVEEWTEDDGTHFLLTKRIPGQCLEEAWPTLSAEDKERVAKQTAEYLMQLRDLRSDRMECLGGTPLHSAFMFGDDYKTGHGPMTSDDELWAEMSRYLSHVPEEARSALRRRMPSAAPYTFTHGDLTIVNLMVDKGHLAGILDWEGSGYFPVWWEFTHAGISLSTEDAEWKALLRKYLPDHTEGREFWKDFWFLRQYPDLEERGLQFLRSCGLSLPEKR